MALTEVTNPRKTLGTTPPYDSDAASTTQLRYVFNESDLTNIDNYILEVEIPELNNLLLYYLPDQTTGNIEFDVGWPLAQGMADNFLEYHIIATPYRNGISETAVTSINILAVFSNIQIGYSEGSNLNELIAKATTPAKPGYFMTFFDEPKIWENWTVFNYIINQDITGTVDVKLVDYDLNKNPITTNTPSDIWAGPPKVESYPLTYSSGASYKSMQYSQTAVALTEEKLYKQEPECINPIMLRWYNELGGLDYWLFEREQTFTHIAEEGLKYESPITGDLSTATGNKFRYAEKDTQFIQLKADHLTRNQVQTLHYLKKSAVVEVALAKDWSKFIQVRVDNGYSTDFTTNKSNYGFFVSIEMPDNYDLLKALEYGNEINFLYG